MSPLSLEDAINMTDPQDRQFYQALLSGLEASLRQTEKNLVERIDRSEKVFTESVRDLKGEVIDLRNKIQELDRQVVVLSTEQHDTTDLKKTMETMQIKLDKLQSEKDELRGALRLSQWIFGVATSGLGVALFNALR